LINETLEQQITLAQEEKRDDRFPIGGLNTCPMHPLQVPDALGGVRLGKSTALRGWTRCGITETLKALITLKKPQWSQRFQWSQWFSGRAQVDEPVGEQAIEE
jgi:hypothetical protein